MNDYGQDLAALLDSVLPVPLRHITYRLRDVGHALGMRVALAGGIPRDLLRVRYGQLDRDRFIAAMRDFDVTVEGDGVAFAKALHGRLPGRLTVNETFHTATLATDDPMQLDVTSARLEDYPAPGALPVVDTSGVSLEQDLLRRDFTVNALAIQLEPAYGLLVDPVGGAGDIQAEILRVLHSRSFSDDPTRLFRALRYGLRLNYDMEPATRSLFNTAVDEELADHLTPERVRYELECIGSEERWAEIWGVMDISGLARSLASVLQGVSRTWDLDQPHSVDIGLNNQPALLAAEGLLRWLVRTAWVLTPVSLEQLPATCARLGLYPRHTDLVIAARSLLAGEIRRLGGDLLPSEVTRILEAYPRPAVALALFSFLPRTEAGVRARKQLRAYLEEYSLVRSELNGHRLIELGLRPGPLLGRVRDQLRYLRLDGIITDLAGEERTALELIAQTPLEDRR